MYTVVTAATIITRKHEPDIVKVRGTKRLRSVPIITAILRRRPYFDLPMRLRWKSCRTHMCTNVPLTMCDAYSIQTYAHTHVPMQTCVQVYSHRATQECICILMAMVASCWQRSAVPALADCFLHVNNSMNSSRHSPSSHWHRHTSRLGCYPCVHHTIVSMYRIHHRIQWMNYAHGQAVRTGSVVRSHSSRHIDSYSLRSSTVWSPS